MPTPRPTDRPIAPATYRIVRHREARGEWFEVEGFNATGHRWIVAVCDDRHEARDLVRRLEADAARRAAAATAEAAADLATWRREAARLQFERRHTAARMPGDALARMRAWSPSLMDERRRTAAAIRRARAAVAATRPTP